LLAEIDENLCRSELSQAQIAAAISRRKQIYIALHPETAAGKSQAKGMNAKLGRGDVSEQCSLTFAAATAAASGMAARGEAITPEKLQKIVGTSLDKAVELDALAKMPVPQRDQLIEAAASGETVTARDSLKGNTHSLPTHAEGDARTGMTALPETSEASAEAPKASYAKAEAGPSGVRSETVTDNTTAHTTSQATSAAAAPSDPVSEVKWAIDRWFPHMDDAGRQEITSYVAEWTLDAIPDFLKRVA
jgi:hypothetical protein